MNDKKLKELIDFIEEVISQKNKRITDEVFLLIQNDKNLMKKYLKLVEASGLTTVNSTIGKRVKIAYSLENDDQRCDEPISTLISSHQEFK